MDETLLGIRRRGLGFLLQQIGQLFDLLMMLGAASNVRAIA
jgi:hypothetical protein